MQNPEAVYFSIPFTGGQIWLLRQFFPIRSDRRNTGDPRYRGNCAGEVVRDLLLYFNPRFFVDPSCGSGVPSGDVARELGIQYIGLDLKGG